MSHISFHTIAIDSSSSPSISIAFNLQSYHFLILKKCVVLHLFPHSLQLTHNLIICELSHISFHIHCNRLAIICEFSNCALSCISFHIDCNWLAILSFSNLEICVVLQFIPHLLHLWIFKLCVFLHLFPLWLQSTCYPIIF